MNSGFLDEQDYGNLIRTAPVLCVDVALWALREGKYVLFRRCNEPLKGELWVIGGRVFKNESVVECALRKLREEAGLKKEIKDLRFQGYYEEVFEFSSLGRGLYHSVSLVFDCECDSLAQITLDSQHSEAVLLDHLPLRFDIKARQVPNPDEDQT